MQSIGLVPMAQPPGKEVLVLPIRVNNGPITRKEALALFISS